ncbi:hypothetical protein BDF21DRAFT_490048 [Thamnidium elegans]|uniref:Uncharacterized protein n=1 Tax=Thamnidium elegans TaxID=101142 RepID=A0A8H7SVT7_9FUNG|nr:hypothetical protein INT48_004321 [Thamnidium elegans]KAI8094568.1 hypothetical protein BDF21DRAFT_490048 [Thamnidium elegans]
MAFPEHLKDFKIPEEEAGSRKFFHDYSIKEWTFENYYRLTHNNLNKSKKKYSKRSTFNSLLIYPFLEAVTIGTTLNQYGAEFKVDECALKSMSKQLKELKIEEDDKSQYKADGIIKLFKMKEIEVLLLETSGSFDHKDRIKINFEHHKGMFGSLAILKTIADEFNYASLNKHQFAFVEGGAP